MHIVADSLQVSVTASINEQTFVSSAEQVPEELVASVESGCKCQAATACRGRDWAEAFRPPHESGCASGSKHGLASPFVRKPPPMSSGTIPDLCRCKKCLRDDRLGSSGDKSRLHIRC